MGEKIVEYLTRDADIKKYCLWIKKNPSKHLNENNSAELKNFSFFKNCFQHATIQYTTIQFKSATIQTN